jgi:predicted DNA-binding transcriptional regulator YafY
MPVTKNPMLRYRILDECFRNGMRSYTIDELLEEVNRRIEITEGKAEIIKLRQLRYDIAYMQSDEGWGIELVEEKFGKKRVYRYEDTSYSIFNSSLTDMQINAIQSVIGLLEGYSSNPEMNHLIDMLDTLKLTADNTRIERKIIGVGINPYLKGREHLIPLYQHIKSNEALHLEYKKFGSEESSREIIHPQYLKEFNQRWFLIAVYENNKDAIRVFALDRIVGFRVAKRIKYFEVELDWEEEYFADIIGVTNYENESPVEIKLRFLNGRGNYVQTKPLHPSQKPVSWIDNQTADVSLYVKINNELEAMLLSYGKDLEIIEPKELKKRLKEKK